jgi:hypothetical protein
MGAMSEENPRASYIRLETLCEILLKSKDISSSFWSNNSTIEIKRI